MHYLWVMLNTFGCWFVKLLDIVVIGCVACGQFVLCFLKELNFCDISAMDVCPMIISSSFHIREISFAIDMLFGKVSSLTTFRDDPNWFVRVNGAITRVIRWDSFSLVFDRGLPYLFKEGWCWNFVSITWYGAIVTCIHLGLMNWVCDPTLVIFNGVLRWHFGGFKTSEI